MMRIFALILLSTLGLAGCFIEPVSTPPPTTISSWSPVGGFTMSTGASCAGHATLSLSSTVIKDACFTASENIVLCTDTTSAAAVRCAPGAGTLTISGIAGDTIAYARVR
jgi:hypothetical protein